MAHTDTYKLSYYYGQNYNTEFNYRLLEEITKENKILFMSRANLVGEVFYILYDIHISELCNVTIQDLVDYYSTEEVIDYYAGTKFPSIEGCIPYVIKLQKLIHTRDDLTDRASALNSLVFMRKETDFFHEFMKLLDRYTPEDMLDDICRALENYFCSMYKHIPSYLQEDFDYDDVEDEEDNTELMVTVLDYSTNTVQVYPYVLFKNGIKSYLEHIGYDMNNCQYMIHSKSDSPWKD